MATVTEEAHGWEEDLLALERGLAQHGVELAPRDECLVHGHERHEDEAAHDDEGGLGQRLLAGEQELGLRLGGDGEREALLVSEHDEADGLAERRAVDEVGEGDAHEVLRAGQLDGAWLGLGLGLGLGGLGLGLG